MFKFLLIIISLVVFSNNNAFAQQSTTAKQAYVIDYETGQILLDKDSTAKMPTSSMSKVMTTYMVFDALKNKRIALDDKFLVSEKAWAKGGSKMFVGQGSKIKIEDLLRGVIIQSGNDATIVLAEGLEGSEENFAKKMTSKALEIGMENSNFTNASGWPDPNHYSTARDLAIMSRRMIEDYPQYYKLFAEKEYSYANINQANRNPLLYSDIGADGLKTGHTEVGGYGLIGTAVKGGRRVLMVLNGMDSEKTRKSESVRLITWGLDNFINKTIFEKGNMVATVPVTMGKSIDVKLVANDNIKLTLPKAPKDNFKIEITYKSPIIAPIQQGDEAGIMTVKIPNMGDTTYPVYFANDVEKLGFFRGTFTKIKHFFFEQLEQI